MIPLRIVLAAALLASGCAGRGVDCLAGPACPDGTSCGVDGTCRPADPQAARFARHVALAPRDWGYTTRAHPRAPGPDRDTLLLGGAEGAAIYLAFGPLPEDAEVVGAVLALHVLGAPDGAALAPWRVIVDQTRTFRGSALTHRGAPPSLRRVSVLEAAPRVGQPLWLEVGAVHLDVEDDGYLSLNLGVRARGGRGGTPARIASPRHADARLRPRLELILR